MEGDRPSGWDGAWVRRPTEAPGGCSGRPPGEWSGLVLAQAAPCLH